MSAAISRLSQNPFRVFASHFSKIQKLGHTLADKISACAKKAFKALKEAFLFPKRYIGAKTWSIPGLIFRLPKAIYHKIRGDTAHSFKEGLFGKTDCYPDELTPLSREDTKPFLKVIYAIKAGHARDLDFAKPFGLNHVKPPEMGINPNRLPNGLEMNDFCFFDSKRGLKASLFQKEDDVFVCFGALQSYESEIDMSCHASLYRTVCSAAIANLAGLKPKIYEEAQAFLQTILDSTFLKDKKVVLAGQCFGGTIAAYLGLKNSMQAIAFNSLPMGPGLQEEIGDEQLSKAHHFVTQISAKSDYLSDPYIFSTIDRFVNLIGIRTAGNFGRRFAVPSAYREIYKTHTFIEGSMMQHIGHHFKTKPAQLPSCELF